MSTIFRFEAPQRAVIPTPTCLSGTTRPIKKDWWTWFWRGRGTKPSLSHSITSHTKNRGRLSDQHSLLFINLETWKKCVEPSTVWMKSIMNKRKECVLYKSDNVGAQWKGMEYDWSHWWIFNEDHSTCIIHALKSEMVTQFYAAFENREDLLIVLGIRKK